MHESLPQGAFSGFHSDQRRISSNADHETTTARSEPGIVNIMVAFAPLKPAEFVILYLHIDAGQIQV